MRNGSSVCGSRPMVNGPVRPPARAHGGAHVGGDQGGDVREKRGVHGWGSFAFGRDCCLETDGAARQPVRGVTHRRLARLRGLICEVASVLPKASKAVRGWLADGSQASRATSGRANE